jgi:serpin B
VNLLKPILLISLNTGMATMMGATIALADFPVEFYQKTQAQSQSSPLENTLVSPYSASIALKMLWEGAGGETGEQIKAALGSSFNPLPVKGVETANALIIQTKVNPEYCDVIKRNYEGEVFHGGLDDINAWCGNKTKGKIPKILDYLDGSICVLLNAVYFNEKWAKAFDKGKTIKETFHTIEHGDIQCDTMKNTSSYNVWETDLSYAIELPYQKNNASMIVFLPKDHEKENGPGLKKLEENLEGEIDKINKVSPKNERVALFMPKFKFSGGGDIKKVLLDMGIKNAFDPNRADFKKIANGAFVVQAVQKAFIENKEEGTEAAAVTAIVMNRCAIALDDDAKEFSIKKPFIFVIKDKNGTLLFIGRVTDPTK